MTKEDQITFTENFLDSIKKDITEKINAGKVPEDWDGFELRELVKDIMDYEATFFNGIKRQKRYQDYERIRINNSLKYK